MKKLCIFLLIGTLTLSLYAAQRTVVFELFLNPCPYCVGAAGGANILAEKYEDNFLLIQYDVDGPLRNVTSVSRSFSYEIEGWPGAVFDGTETRIGGYPVPAYMFEVYDSMYQKRAAVESPVEINLYCNISQLDLTSGELLAIICNPTGEKIDGRVFFTIAESHIPCAWYPSLDTMNFILRTLLPDTLGKLVSIDPGEDYLVEQQFTIDTVWPNFTKLWNIQFGCFVQGSNKEIYQGAMLDYTATEVKEEAVSHVELRTPAILVNEGSLSIELASPSNVSIGLYDASGRVVKNGYSGYLSSGTHDIPFDIRKLSRGAYFVKVVSGDRTWVKKLIILNK